MKLSKVDITYFRCFESLSIPLQPDVNVFVGINGAGKTAILDAIAIALWDIVAANGGGGKRERDAQHVLLRPSDIYVPPGEGAKKPDFVQVRASAGDFYVVPGFTRGEDESVGRLVEWQEHIRIRQPQNFDYDNRNSEGLSELYKYFESLWDEIRTTGPEALVPLPVVAYYRAQRRLNEMPELGEIFSRSLDRHGAFQGALNAGANYRAMCQWFYLRENQELREKVQTQKDANFEMPDLKAVRLAIFDTVENVERIFFDGTPPRLKVALGSHNGAGQVLELEQLSDGYRNLLAVVLDFARRLAQANPNFKNPLEAPGILLIDEIELHLHPRWQQTVIPRLRKVFPNTQLLVTTHSPQVLTTVDRRNIFILKDLKLFSPNVGTYGSESSHMLEEVLQTGSRPPDNKNAESIRELYRLINSGELAEASALRKELASSMGSAEPALLEAEAIIRNREWERELNL
ncbi:MAG: AAA family ATPase [Syntrophobacteraceae bacterium]